MSTFLALVILPAAEAIDGGPAAADPAIQAEPAPGLLAYSSKEDSFHYLATTDFNGEESSVLPLDVSPPAASDEGDSRAGLTAWIADEDGRAILTWDGTTVTTVVPEAEGVYNRSPAISPDGTQIAFSRSTFGGVSKIWVVNADGTGLRQVTTGTLADYWPTWDPSGENIAFSRYVNATFGYEIYRTNVLYPVVTRLTTHRARDTEPAWSLDGSRIAFTTYNRYNGADGYPTTEVVSISALGGDLRREVYPYWPRPSSQPVWASEDSGATSPIAFTSTDSDGASTGVYTRLADQTVIPVSDDPDFAEDDPFWSPELGTVGYTAYRSVPTSRLHTIRQDGSDQQQFSDRWDDRDDAPAYSPEGSRIAFSRASDDRADIVITDLVTGTETLLPGARPGFREYFTDPVWSPDGRFIAYGHEFAYVNGGEFPPQVSTIAVVELATGTRTELPVQTSTNGYFYSFDGEPSWDPASGQLVFSRTWVPTTGTDPDPGGPVITSEPGVMAAFPEESDTDLYLTSFPFPPSAPTQLTNDLASECDGGCEDRGPAWSPTNPSAIVFARDFDDLIVVDPATGALTPLSVEDDEVYGVADPAWAPDGVDFAFTGYGSESPPSIWVLPAAGGAPAHLTSTPYDVGQPAYQPTADLEVIPTVDNGTIDFSTQTTIRVTVTNLGRQAAAPELSLDIPAGLTIDSITPDSGTCNPVTLVCSLPVLAPQVPWRVAIVVTGSQAGNHQITAAVVSPVVDPNLVNNQASAFLTVLDPPDLTVAGAASPAPGFVGGDDVTLTFIVQNGSGVTARGVVLDVDFPVSMPVPIAANPSSCLTADPCPLGDMAPGASRIVTYTIDASVALDELVIGAVRSNVIDPNPVNNVSTVRVQILQPLVETNPDLSVPGRVIEVTGKNFPPGATVEFAWSEGISGGERATAAQNGTFTVMVLIFGRDRPAERDLTATRIAGPGFGDVSAPFLVIPGNQGPPDFIGRR